MRKIMSSTLALLVVVTGSTLHAQEKNMNTVEENPQTNENKWLEPVTDKDYSEAVQK